MRRYFNQRVQILDTNGDPVPGAKLEFFEAGTSNQLDTYSDFDLSTPNTNPVVCDSGGYANIFLKKNRLYDYTTVDANDVTVYPKQLDVSSYEPPLTTKGDIFTFDTDFQRLGVGGDGTYLKADSSQATGLAWDNPSEATLTTKGDLYTYDTGNARLPVGNDGDVLTADSSETTGLKWIALPKAAAYRSTNQSISASTWTKVVFDTEEFDTGSDFATGTFTCDTDGKYLIVTTVSMGTFGDQDPVDLLIYKNGSPAKYAFGLGTSTASTEIAIISGAAILDLVATDTIDIYARQEDAGINIIGGADDTFVAISRLV